MKIKFTGGYRLYNGFSIHLDKIFADVHVRVYTELGITDLERDSVIEFDNFDEERQNDRMFESEEEEDEDDELQMLHLESDNEELPLVFLAPSVCHFRS